ncbi:MAG: hypothetical protein NXH87_11435 [Rhodobiaceae bacterium]|nr:hypothetical protein [Rhodobiaceae bacterium]
MRNAVIVAFVALNTVIFGYIGYEMAIGSAEDAAKEGLALNIYRSFLYIEIIIVASWVLIGWSALKGRLELFKASSWFYLGFIICDGIISHQMSVVAEDALFTPASLVLVALQCGFLMWAYKKVDWR